MESDQEQFTRRMLGRASTKKDGDQVEKASLKRRLNILKAIDDRELQNRQVTGSGEKTTAKEEKKSKKEFKSQFIKNNTRAGKRNYVTTSSSWTRIHSPFLKPIQSCMESDESEEKLTQDQYLPQRNSKFVEHKMKENLIKETRIQEKRPTRFQESCHVQWTPNSNPVPIKEMMLHTIENMQFNEATNSETAVTAWESTLENCINTYSAKIKSGNNNITNRKEANSKNLFPPDYGASKYPCKSDLGEFNFPINDLSFTKSDLRFPKRDSPLPKGDFHFRNSDLHFPRPYRTSVAKLFKPKVSESCFSYVTETSVNDVSRSSYIKGFEWRDPSEIFGNNIQKATTPQLLRVEYKTIAGPEKVTEFKTIDPSSDFKECSPPSQMYHLKNAEESEYTETESGSLFSLSSAIKNLDEDIQNLQLKPEAEAETPKKFLPLMDEENPRACTPRKLFQKDFENKEKENTTPEVSNKIRAREGELSEIQSSLLKTHSSIFGFKTPKSWRRKPNLESTRKVSNFDSTQKTISRSQVGSTPSSINPNTLTNPEIEEKKSPNVMESTIPYTVEQFLQEALGENLYNDSITYALSDMRDGTNSNLNASELISEEKTPPRRNRVPKTPKTEPARYSTLNRTITAYKSLTQSIKKKFRPNLKESPNRVWNPYLSVSPPRNKLDDKLHRLLHDLNVQQTFIYQASKALDYCRTMKQFKDSPEQVESHRLILLANIRKQVIFKEVRRLATKPNESLLKGSAEMTIEDISLTLKEGVLRRERQIEDVAEWFMVVLSQGVTVWATHAKTCPINSPRIYFSGCLSISNLNSDFKINLKVYSLKINNSKFNHEETYHIVKEAKHKMCPSPTNLLKRSERPLSPRSHGVKFSGLKESSFDLMGVVDFELCDLSSNSPWLLRSVPEDSVLCGTVDLNLSCKLHLSVSHSGFLNYGDVVGGFALWNRRWCILEGHTLMFWNYPREEEIKNPLLIIDLTDCKKGNVKTIDRTHCAKPRTFVIETSSDRSEGTIISHLLQCDTVQSRDEWMKKINDILSVLTEWKVIGTSKN